MEDFIRKEINVPIKEFVDIPFEDKEAMKETLAEFHTFYKENFLGE